MSPRRKDHCLGGEVPPAVFINSPPHSFSTNHIPLYTTMLIIGLTGSIATGKSTVSSLLSRPPHCLPIIDADILAREVVIPGTRGYKAIVSHFGPTTPDLLLPPNNEIPENGKDGKGRPLNRAALGRRVFGDSEERKRERKVLNGIVHPAVRLAMARKILHYYIRGHWAVVLDIPLLFESGLDIFCGTVIVVAVKDPAVQMKRLRDRDPHLSAEEAENRVRSQVDVREKARKVLGRGETRGEVVWNDKGRDELEADVEKCLEKIRGGSPGWWSWLLLLVSPLAGVVAGWEILEGLRARRRWEGEVGREKAKL